MKTFINNDIYNSLPQELKSAIIDTKTVSGHGPEDTNNFTSIDKLYLLSSTEVWGNGLSDTSIDQTRQLDYYNEKGVTTSSYASAIKKNNGTASWWFLRCAQSNNDSRFLEVTSSGNENTLNASAADGVSPAFRIG